MFIQIYSVHIYIVMMTTPFPQVNNLNIKIMFGVELVHLDESNPTNVGICREYRGIYREY